VWKAARPWRAHRLIIYLFITLPPASASTGLEPLLAERVEWWRVAGSRAGLVYKKGGETDWKCTGLLLSTLQ